MKILFLSDNIPPESSGGDAIITLNMAINLKKKGHDVFILTSVQEKGKEGKTEYEGINIFRLYANYNQRWWAYLGLYNFQVISKLKRILSEVRPDVVHAQSIWTYISFYSLRWAKKYSKRVFLTAHDVLLFHYGKLTEFIDFRDIECKKNFNYKVSIIDQIQRIKKRYNPFRSFIIRIILKRYVDRIFSVSEALKEALEQNGISNVVVMHNVINVEDWRVNRQEELILFKKNLGIFDNKVVLFASGVLKSPWKGGEQIVRSMKQVVLEVPEAVLLIAGQRKGYADSLVNIAKGLKIEEMIIFTGWLSGQKKKLLFNCCDLVVVPSICLDPFPTVNLEALACKKPVVGTCFGGTPEIIKDGAMGYIVNPLNIDKMAEKIIYLLKNPDRARMFGENGFKSLVPVDRQINELEAWYQGRIK